MKFATASMTLLLALAGPAAHADDVSPAPADELNNHPTIAVIAADRLVGRNLEDFQFQPVGSINALVIDTTTGQVEFVVIKPIEAIQAHGQLIAIPWAELDTPATMEGPLHLKVTQAILAQAPRIEPKLIFELARPEERDRMFGFFGANAGALDGGSYDRENKLAAHDRQVALEEHSGMVPGAAAKPPAGSRLVLADAGVIARLSALTSTSAAAMDDAGIYNAAGKDIGDLDATMIDVVTGRVAYVLVSHGGFLGMDESLSAAPIEALALSPYRNRYRLTVATSVLEQQTALHVSHGYLPSSVSLDQLGTLYARFGIQPYWTGTKPPAGQAGANG